MKLELGCNHPIEVRSEKYRVHLHAGFRVLYLSDLHLNAYGAFLVRSLIVTIDALNPDIILLGGDYVDSKKGLDHFTILMKAIATRPNVFAIAGNHDYFFGLDKIRNIITAHNGTWIEKSSFTLTWNNTIIRIDGNLPDENIHTADISILCLHKPLNIAQYASNYHLAFAGHLHGCQAVLWQSDKGLFPGRFFYKWNILKTTLGQCRYFISKGLGDTLPIRYNCKRDIILVEFVKA